MIKSHSVYNEWMFNTLKNLLLVLDVIHVLTLDDVCFLHALDCVLLVNLPLDPAHSHISESTYNGL